MNSPSVLILAAGKGIRMKSQWPKVLHSLNSRPMVLRVLDTLKTLRPTHIGMVVGHGGDQVQNSVLREFPNIRFFLQKKLDGSGGAVRTATSWLNKKRGHVLVVCGDAPLIRPETLKKLISFHKKSKSEATVLTTLLNNPTGYGRIIRSGNKRVMKIVEELDASPIQRQVQEINSGTYCFRSDSLVKALKKIRNNNKKKEYYLTDVLEILSLDNNLVSGVVCDDFNEILGINNRRDLAQAQQVLYERKRQQLMEAGVTLTDPATVYADDLVEVGPDTVIGPNVILKGKTKIGSHCQIGAWSHISDTVIENHVDFKASFSDSAHIKSGAIVGPFSRIRPKTYVGESAHIGNFSELKNTQLGKGSKVNHLSYLGDAIVGKNVNIGAGTITCNYDGIRKSPTSIEDHAFIGSNANLIAPIKIGSHAVVGAGSSLSEDVPSWSLAVERGRSIIRRGWAKNKFKKQKRKKS